MRKQQPTPVEPGTHSTEADAVQVAGKPGSSWVKYKPKATDAGAVQVAGKPTKSKFHRGKDLAVKMALN